MFEFSTYPRSSEANVSSLQSKLFGHRLKGTQTKYEYLIEFLQVAISNKEYQLKLTTEMFPIDPDIGIMGFKFSPISRIGLKRFIFFPKSKLDSKAKVDKDAYTACIRELEAKVHSHSAIERQACIATIQNLLYGFTAINQNRSWFDQNILPICKEVILPEGLGKKGWRSSLIFEQGKPYVDNKFEYNSYTYMCRGGEVYYLHILNALNHYPDYRTSIQTRLTEMIDAFPQFSLLCNFVNNSWEEYMMVSEEDKKIIKKTVGTIPYSFSLRNEYTLKELKNFLNSKTDPFEKMSIFANGIILQMMRMMYIAAATESNSNCWVLDMHYNGLENNEVKKIAISAFKKNEEVISTYLYAGLENYRDLLDVSDEGKVIKDAAEDSYKLFRKLGKMIGIIIPSTGRGMRFSLSEDIIKFLVLSIIPPKNMITLDKFIELLYEHFGMVIRQEEYRLEIKKGSLNEISDLSFLDNNQKAFIQKLKDCGFLRDLSDATSIVENPYESEE